MWRLVMSRSTATLRAAKRPSYTIVVSFKSEMSGRTSPDLSSDMNGSRPPPSYAKTSRSSVCGCCDVVSRSGCWAARRFALSAASTSARLAARTRSSGCGFGGPSGGARCGRLHEGANLELGEQQRACGVGEQLLRGRGRARQRDVLRYDDPRQRRDVGEILADLIVMAEDLEPVAVGVERIPGLGRERLNLAERDAADLGPRRDVVDQR